MTRFVQPTQYAAFTCSHKQQLVSYGFVFLY